jgi:hypothetical protein
MLGSLRAAQAGRLCSACKLNRERDCRDHAVLPRDAFASNLEGCAVIGAGARKRQTERNVHAAVESVQLQWDQTLIVIHAENGIEFTFSGATKDGVGRKRADEDCGLRIADCGLQFFDRWRDDFDFFATEFTRFAGVRI